MSVPIVPTIAASDPASSTLPPLKELSNHDRRISRLPASTLTAAVAGPAPGGSSSTASRQGRAPRLTFCSGPIFTGKRSASTTPAKHTGTISQRHVWAAARDHLDRRIREAPHHVGRGDPLTSHHKQTGRQRTQNEHPLTHVETSSFDSAMNR